MSTRAELFDATLFLGAYIYEYASGSYAGNGPVRLHDPAHELRTLNFYRRRYARYRTDADLQAAHAALPWIVVWDDHETANNSWANGAENHDPNAQGDWLTRRDCAPPAHRRTAVFTALLVSATWRSYPSQTCAPTAM